MRPFLLAMFTFDGERLFIRFRPFQVLDALGIARKPTMDMIELSRDELKKYKITSRFGGIRRCLILFIEDKGNIKRVPINLSLMPIQDLTQLIRVLYKFRHGNDAPAEMNVVKASPKRKRRRELATL
jgi:hypothetical protein